MTPEVFDDLLYIVGPAIQKHEGFAVNPITAGERLSVTLRYLASGDSMISIGYGYRIAVSTVSNIIKETTAAIWDNLKALTFPPLSTSTWQNIAADFYNKWNFPNCLGAIDGKHVIVQAFSNSGSTCYNYKNSHSIVLMAVCDADYKFIFVDIGASGKNNDSGIFRRSEFGKRIVSKSPTLQIPNTVTLPGSIITVPYCYVGDEAFPLLENIMHPFPGRRSVILAHEQDVFNYRLSRARRVVENAFGVLSSKWRIFRKPIIASRESAVNMVKAAVCLHNWLRMNSGDTYQYFHNELVDHYNGNGDLVLGEWRTDGNNDGFRNIGRMRSNNPNSSAVDIRNRFANYFTNVDILSWQNDHIHD